uniref:Restriction endonuclease n=1 Tax=Pithovirus LCPAC404 TaxID=2506597 RepID=A0A481ZBM7_9VIRU|nr:MAG: restriction endonuclease [Pithovirus LCPAC404]
MTECKCRIWKQEERCRDVFEELFPGYKFKKQRPGFLEGLELDGYCSRLLLAFEFDGKQHFEQVKIFQKTRKKFKDQQRRDKKKNVLCKQNGVKLIRIPYNFEKSGDTLNIYIVKAVIKLGYKVEMKMKPSYVVILDQKEVCDSADKERKELLHLICRKLNLFTDDRTTTRELILFNKDYWNENLFLIRQTFGLKSNTKPTTIQGYLAFLNSVFRVGLKGKLMRIKDGVYQMKNIDKIKS